MSNTTTPKIFKTKNNLYACNLYKKSVIPKDKFITNMNCIFKPKHYPPYIREWVNGIYSFNKNNVKSLPSLDVNIYNLIKSYFNFYILKYNNITRTRGWRVRRKKSTTQRLIASKPSIKHTNDKVNVTIYTYDKSSPQYIEKIAGLFTINQLNNQYDKFFINLKNNYVSLESNLKNILKNKYLKKYVRNTIINKYKPSLFKDAVKYNSILAQNRLNYITNNNLLNFSDKELGVVYNNNINNYIKKVMWYDIVSIFYRQCLSFEQSKYEKQHAQLLTTSLENIYKKKVILDIVNLKYFYNSSSIFSSVILAKLKIKKNKVIDVLGSALDTFNIPPLDRIKVYDEMYNRKMFKQNVILKKLVVSNDSVSQNINSKIMNDIVDSSLHIYSSKYSVISSLNNTKQWQLNTYNINLHEIMNLLKNKFTKGIRIETAGRLTKRNTAERSIYKLAYKGNLKNQDSSMKSLPTVLLRGHAKSNLVYTHSKSRLRVGSFGLKTWVSSE